MKSRKSTSGTVTSILQVPLAFDSRTQSTVATSSAGAELYASGLGISDSLRSFQLLQKLQHHCQPRTFDFGSLDARQPYNLCYNNKILDFVYIAHQHLHRQHISVEPHQQAWTQQVLKAHALRYYSMQDIQATGLANVQRVTSHNNPLDVYAKRVSSQVLERRLCHNGIIELHIKERDVNNILQFAAQHIKCSENSEDQRQHVQQKFRRQLRQFFKKKKNQHIGGDRQEAAQCADIEHKQSQSLLQHQALAHRAQHQPPIMKTSKDKKEEQLDLVMEESTEDLGDDHILFISMIDFRDNHYLPQQRPESQPETTLPPNSTRTTADIMADTLEETAEDNYDISQ